MMVTSFGRSGAVERLVRDELGEAFFEALGQAGTTDIALRPDGRLQVKSGGNYTTITVLEPASARRAVYALGGYIGIELNEHTPFWEGAFPLHDARLTVLVPPIVAQPSFALRLHAFRIIPFESMIGSGSITETQVAYLREVVRRKEDNLIVAGETGSGKTTLLNTLLAEQSQYPWAVITIEDRPELRSSADSWTGLHAYSARGDVPGMSMERLVELALGLDPDIIVVGEAREPRAVVALLNGWSTGHTGGMMTIHANSAEDVFRVRLPDLVAQAGLHPVPRTILAACRVAVFMAPRHRRDGVPRVERIVRAVDFRDDAFVFEAVE